MRKRSKKWWALKREHRRSDKSVGRHEGVPWYYRHFHFEVPRRRRNKAILRDAVANGEVEDVIFIAFKRDAGYTYW